MGQPTVALISEYQQAKQRKEIRVQIHKVIDDWIDKVDAGMKEPKPTLEQITGEVFKHRQELTAAFTKSLIAGRYQPEQGQQFHQCPKCGRYLSERGNPGRNVETMVGTIEIKRPYFYCEKCSESYYPMDEALQLGHRRKQSDVQEATVKLTKEVPYETACELLEELTGVKVSTKTAHEMTQEVAQGLTVLDVSPSRDEVLKKIEEAATDKTWRPILALAIDGANTPTRPESARGKGKGRKKVRAKRAQWKGEWKEAKGFRFYLVFKDRIEHLISWHQIGDYEQVYEALAEIKKADLIPEDKVRFCILADGAHWIWDRVKKELFPTAKEILDYYHCSEYIHRVANSQYLDRPDLAFQWVEATMIRLFCGEASSVIWGLQRMNPFDEQAADEIERTIIYLENNQHRIDYNAARKGGYPIGSGGIESANKFICHVRLKRSGAWWYIPNGNHMLALRCAKYNGTFDRVCRRIRQ
jgi:predicted Rdx family selenoprotein